jgi:hypothetical protein
MGTPEIEVILTRLRELSARIKEARAALAPLETALASARREFDEQVGPLRREAWRLENDLEALRAPAPPLDFMFLADPGSLGSQVRPVSPVSVTGRDAVEKDVLLEHLVWVLDPDTDHEAGLLLARIQGLCNDPATSLADVLEELPWGQAWTARQHNEATGTQGRRLAAWELALRRQLAALEQKREGLIRHDPRYRLYEQRQRGEEAWDGYLRMAAERQRDRNGELRAELEELQASKEAT